MSTSSTPTQLSQHLLGNFHTRKFMQQYPTESPITSPVQQISHALIDNNFDANVIFVLSVLICSVISSLGLFCIVKCAMKYSRATSVAANPSTKLAKQGIEKKALQAFTTIKYTSELKLPGLDSACVICLSEFVAGESLRILPKCNHGFHTRCIDIWLSSNSSCPTCRHCLTRETEQETVINCSRAVGRISAGAGKCIANK